jgi:GNAT superfamily N-acetyltransferase
MSSTTTTARNPDPTAPYDYRDGTFLVSTNQALLNLDFIHAELTASYWAGGIPRELVERSIRHSLSFGLYQTEPYPTAPHTPRQVGFARLITDYASYGRLCDVVITRSLRGRGLGKLLTAGVMAHPVMEELRRVTLSTKDAHGLYKKFGFTPLDDVGRHMQINRKAPYKTPQ